MNTNTTTVATIVSALIALRTRNGKSSLAKTGASPEAVRTERIGNVFNDLFSCVTGGGYDDNRDPAKLAEWTAFYNGLKTDAQEDFRRALAIAVAKFVDMKTAAESAKELAAKQKKENKKQRQAIVVDVMSLLS